MFKINTKTQFEWAHKQLVPTLHTIFYFLHDKSGSKITIKRALFTHGLRGSFTLFTFDWMTSQLKTWRHSWDAVTWKLIYQNCYISILFALIFTAGHETGDIYVRNENYYILNTSIQHKQSLGQSMQEIKITYSTGIVWSLSMFMWQLIKIFVM